MDRIEIKQEAREKIKGNIWNIIWPLLVIGFITGAISSLFQVEQVEKVFFDSHIIIKTTSPLGTGIVAIIGGLLSAGYIKYILNFTRKGKFNTKDIINTIKEKWLNIIIATILVTIIVCACTILLIVPGIIMGIAYTFALYLVVDTNIEGNDSLKASREMMQGYKWNYFVFKLSFLGWILLGILTVGILYIWLIPYMQVADTIYYERLKAKTNK